MPTGQAQYSTAPPWSPNSDRFQPRTVPTVARPFGGDGQRRRLATLTAGRTGGIPINASASSRVGPMRDGGLEDRGYGREGPKYAIGKTMEKRLLTISSAGAA